MSLKLILGNKNYSSWSLRPWIAMRHAGIAFDEEVIPLYEPGSRERVLNYSPAGKVPVLIDGDMTIWESLAILEHLAERFPKAQLWPRCPEARAHARAVAAEMHAGFGPLRRYCPMNMRAHQEARTHHGSCSRRAADRGHLDRLPLAVRAGRPVPVRPLQRG